MLIGSSRFMELLVAGQSSIVDVWADHRVTCCDAI
jgi:hypothetical protein